VRFVNVQHEFNLRLVPVLVADPTHYYVEVEVR
jgi:hypothetical protein